MCVCVCGGCVGGVWVCVCYNHISAQCHCTLYAKCTLHVLEIAYVK